MTVLVDFLPDAYRGNTQRRAATRERMLMAIPVVLALVAMDLVMRHRVRGVQLMADKAKAHAGQGALIGEEAKDLASRATTLQTTLAEWSTPLAAVRLTELLDDLLAERPAGIHLHELAIRHQPWTPAAVPSITLAATCTSPTEFTTYLDLLRTSELLPPLQCERTDQIRADAAFTFHLETKTVRRPR